MKAVSQRKRRAGTRTRPDTNPNAYGTVCRSLASPTGWVEVHDDCDDDFAVVLQLTPAELLAHPLVRVLSAEEAEEADRVWREG